jgi:hypothetical protein
MLGQYMGQGGLASPNIPFYGNEMVVHIDSR